MNLMTELQGDWIAYHNLCEQYTEDLKYVIDEIGKEVDLIDEVKGVNEVDWAYPFAMGNDESLFIKHVEYLARDYEITKAMSKIKRTSDFGAKVFWRDYYALILGWLAAKTANKVKTDYLKKYPDAIVTSCLCFSEDKVETKLYVLAGSTADWVEPTIFLYLLDFNRLIALSLQDIAYGNFQVTGRVAAPFRDLAKYIKEYIKHWLA